MPWRRPQKPLRLPPVPKGHEPQPREGFALNALVNIDAEVFVRKAYGRSGENAVYRIVDIVKQPNGWFFDYGLQNVQTNEVSRQLYKESELTVLPRQRVEEGNQGGGESSSKRENEWDAKTLVSGGEDVGSRDDETLYGDYDEREAARRG